MNTQITRRILALGCSVALVLIVPMFASGAESSSFKMYSNLDESDATPLGSSSYTLDEGGGTWTAFPLTGNTFQIVTAPPASSSSSSSSVASEVSSTTTTTGGGGGDGGGRRPRPSSSSSSSDSFVSTPISSASSASNVVDIPLDANVVPSAPDADRGTNKPAAGSAPSTDTKTVPGVRECSGNACVCECPTSEVAHGSAAESFVRIPVLIPTTFQSPLPSMLLLIIAYILGYGSRVARSGEIKISQPNQKSKRSSSKKK